MSQSPQELAKKIEAQEQKLSILKATVKASEGQWVVRKRQIVDDTEVTIETSRKAIAEATKSAKLELESLRAQIKTTQEQTDKEQKKQHATVLELEQSIKGLEHTQKVLTHINATLQEDNRVLESEVFVRQETVDTLKTAEEGLSTNIAELHVQQEQVEDQLVTLRKDLAVKTDELTQLKVEIKTQTDQFNTDISILEQKKQNLAQEIVENRSKDDKVRENLASWSKQLDERDKNLRIRESRVNEQEKAITRNYNLLNL